MTEEPRDTQFPGRIPAVLASGRRAWLRVRLALARSWPGRFRYRATRLALVPPHIHLSDPSLASDFLAGQIVLAGRSLLTGGRAVLDLPPPSTAFAISLHGFDWLRHFEASGDPVIREGARTILRQWLDRREAGGLADAERPEAIARRVIAWITHSPLLTEKSDFEHYRRLLASLARDAATLRIFAGRRDLGISRLECSIALLFHALSLDRPVAAIRQAEALFLPALAEGIAEDGGPMNRDAGTAVAIAANLIPALALYRARQITPPAEIAATLLRMTGFIRMMRHPDGGLALFNGAGRATRDLAAQVTRFGTGQVARRESAPQTGFERLENETGLLIADTGIVPRFPFDTEAGAGALAFEFSSKSDRIIVSCGFPPGADAGTIRSFRQGAAHSGLLIDDMALGDIRADRDVLGEARLRLVGRAGAIPPARARLADREILTLSHAGFRAATGYVVERQFALLPEGGLSGTDRVRDPDNRGENRRITLAFHLHPRVLPVPLSRQDAVVLRLPHQNPGRDLWLFEAPGIALHLEESRCYEQDIISPKTEAIIIDLAISGPAEINWRITPYRG